MWIRFCCAIKRKAGRKKFSNDKIELMKVCATKYLDLNDINYKILTKIDISEVILYQNSNFKLHNKRCFFLSQRH